MVNLSEGSSFPNIVLTDHTGVSRESSELRGEWLLLLDLTSVDSGGGDFISMLVSQLSGQKVIVAALADEGFSDVPGIVLLKRPQEGLQQAGFACLVDHNGVVRRAYPTFPQTSEFIQQLKKDIIATQARWLSAW